MLAGLDPPRLDEARGWFPKAADTGHPLAKFNLGLVLKRLEIPHLHETRASFERTARDSDTEAMVNSGCCC